MSSFFPPRFPFFNVVDEQVHLDLVVRYSQADIPRTLTPPAPESLPYIALFGTPEYLWPPKTFPGGVIPPPPWTQPMAAVRDTLLAKMNNSGGTRSKITRSRNRRYIIRWRAIWWRLCQAMGFEGGGLLYYLRFFNLFLVVAIFWLGWLAARRVFPENRFIHMRGPGVHRADAANGFLFDQQRCAFAADLRRGVFAPEQIFTSRSSVTAPRRWHGFGLCRHFPDQDQQPAAAGRCSAVSGPGNPFNCSA